MMLWKCCNQYASKRSAFIPIQKKAMPNNVQTTAQMHLSHILAK